MDVIHRRRRLRGKGVLSLRQGLKSGDSFMKAMDMLKQNFMTRFRVPLSVLHLTALRGRYHLAFPLRMHPHYQPPLPEHQLAGPTARMQELTLLQRSPRQSSSVPGSGYHTDAERTAPGQAYSSAGSNPPYHGEPSSAYPARVSNVY